MVTRSSPHRSDSPVLSSRASTRSALPSRCGLPGSAVAFKWILFLISVVVVPLPTLILLRSLAVVPDREVEALVRKYDELSMSAGSGTGSKGIDNTTAIASAAAAASAAIDDQEWQGAPPAYVISLVQCSTDPTGFLDAAAIFLHSVWKNSNANPANPNNTARYGYAAYAIVHRQCDHHAPLLQRLGYTTLVRDTPFQRSQIRGTELRNSIERALCCGSAEYIKLYAYTLTDHPVVLHFDLDCIILQPLDELFDAMLYPQSSLRYQRAMASIALERRADPIPKRIDAYLSMDYSLNWPWHREAPAQGGWLVIRPSHDVFDEYINIVLEGNWTGGFNNDAGWGHLGYGGWIGSAAIQGIVAYYYGHYHRGTTSETHGYVELDVCRYNQIGADMIYRRAGDSNGQCKKYARNAGEEYDCTDCRGTDVALVKSVHYCACKKPWGCPVAREKPRERHRIDVLSGLVDLTTCNILLREWFLLRREYEDRMYQESGDANILSSRRGKFKQDVFLDYCEGEGKYIPIVHPKEVLTGEAEAAAAAV
mmetsp:Transcript_562/g.843  ORF Transcript_562/g.843 Transcript_562/m.843 type:complete len:538 (-) Transcript_562:19-1632(-)